MVKSKNRFQFGIFLNTLVIFLMWQLLNRPSQLKIQRACIIALFQPAKRRKIFARLNPVGTAAMASKFRLLPFIETITYEDEEVISLYINVRIGKHKLNKTLVNFGAVVELLSQNLLQDPVLYGKRTPVL